MITILSILYLISVFIMVAGCHLVYGDKVTSRMKLVAGLIWPWVALKHIVKLLFKGIVITLEFLVAVVLGD